MRVIIRRWVASALALLLAISPTVLANEAADRAALEATAQAWIKAFNSRNTQALLALTTVDVILLDPTLPPVSGREAARKALAQALGAAKGQITSATKEAVITGDVAWRIGALTHKLSSGDVLGRGQSLEIWKRMKGEWQLHRQMSSTLLAQPKLLSQPLPSEPVLDKPTD